MSVASKFAPLLNRVLVEKVVPAAKSAGGILLPSAPKAGVQQGVVVAVGPGLRTQDGKIVPTVVKNGDNVLLPEFGGNEIKIDNQSFFLYREDDILGVVSKD